MRAAFVDAMLAHAKKRDIFFLTGDLGFMVLEPLRDALAKRFINCGVAEQNMIGVAAGLTRAGHEVWVYRPQFHQQVRGPEWDTTDSTLAQCWCES